MSSKFVGSTPIIIIILTLTILPALPVLPAARAVTQAGPTNWSPYGPNMRNLLITVYSDFQTMFNAFTAGQLDITDWPVQPADLSSFGSNPDFFLTSPTSDFGIFQVDFNHHSSILSVPQQTARTKASPTITTVTTTTGCSTGFGRLQVRLKNLEESTTLIIDPLNKVKVQGPVNVSPVKDDPTGGTSADGTYVLPSPTTCMLAGTYTVSSTVYEGSGTTPLCPSPCSSGEIRTVELTVNYNSPSTVKPTSAGIELRRAIAHLLDKPNFINVGAVGGLADYDDMQAPPSQGLSVGGAPNAKLPTSILQEDCTGSNPSNSVNPHPWVATCNPVSAYNLQPDTIGAAGVWWAADGSAAGATSGYSGATDIRASCDHFVRAGFTVANGDCQSLANTSSGATPPSCANVSAYTCPRLVPPGGANQQIILYIRSHPPRKAFGQIIADTLQFMLGTPNHQTNNAVTTCAVNYGYLSPGNGCTPTYYSITQIFDIVFGILPGGVPPGPNFTDDWSIYTGGFILGSLPDHLYGTYHSSFAGNVCGGLAETYPGNYPFYCNALYDAESSAAEFSSSLTDANGFFGNAAIVAQRTVMTVPVFSLVSQFVALNGWNYQSTQRSSLVADLGHGFQLGYWSLMNMRQLPGYDPCAAPNAPSNCALFVPGGGDPALIRRGFSQDVHKLSPFHALTLWDFEVISQIYDSMLQVNPLTGGTGQQVVDWMTTSHTSSFNPSEVSCLGTNCVTGTTTQKWYLRGDLKWHDGSPVTTDDVIYTITAYRDVPSANLQPNVANVASTSTCGMNCVQVKLQQQSPFYELNIGGLPIIPKHVWEPICGSPPGPTSLCADPSFDPMFQGKVVGSGPWVCKNGAGAVGGPCTSSGTQDVTLGGQIVLTANEDYMKGPTTLQGSSLQKASWSDKNNDGVVNILDIADAALHFGQPDTYWDHSLFGVTTGFVDIGEIATIAFYFDHGITKPFSPSALTSLDPQIDPYRGDLTPSGGPIVYYQGGLRTLGQLTTRIVIVSGTANPGDFSVTLKTESGANIGTVTGVQGSTPSIVLFNFGAVSAGRYILTANWNGHTILTQNSLTLILG